MIKVKSNEAIEIVLINVGIKMVRAAFKFSKFEVSFEKYAAFIPEGHAIFLLDHKLMLSIIFCCSCKDEFLGNVPTI